MNVRLFAFGAAILAGSGALAAACGAPDLVVPPPVPVDSSAPSSGPCSASESARIRGNVGIQTDADVWIDCKGKVVAYDPPAFGDSSSEGLCDAAIGYLVCDSGCFSGFSCEIPDGYTLVELDGAPIDTDDEPDAGTSSTDAGMDAKIDDAAPDAKRHEAGVDANPDVSSEASSDAVDETAPDAPVE